MTKAQIVIEIVLLLQGTPVDDFARHNLAAAGNKVIVRCAETAAVGSPEGQLCKRAMATALEHLEPEAVPRVRATMCDATSDEAQQDPAAARAVCDRLSMDF